MAKKPTKKKAAKKAPIKKKAAKKVTPIKETILKTEITTMSKTKTTPVSDKVNTDLETIAKATDKGFTFSANQPYKVIVETANNFLEALKKKK